LPEVLQEWLDTNVKGVLDIGAYNHEVEQQTSEAAAFWASGKRF
jgi:hypothetical protein